MSTLMGRYEVIMGKGGGILVKRRLDLPSSCFL